MGSAIMESVRDSTRSAARGENLLKVPLSVEINGRAIGPDFSPYVIAEMSGNHNRELSRALTLLDRAKAAGVDAVKLQTYRPDTITIDHGSEEFFVEGGLWDGRRLYDLYEEAHTPWEWHAPLFDHARKMGLTLFSSPFDFTAVDLLESLDAPAYKIASPELIDLPLIKYVARLGRPMILSTGMASEIEISEAVETAVSGGAGGVIVLHCTSAYPTKPEDANLSTMQEIRDKFGVITGLSDHTEGHQIAALAVALGADVIEKHFTLDRSEGGVDSEFSLEPHELQLLVGQARLARLAVGNPTFAPTEAEHSVLKNRRSLYVVEPMVAGEAFTPRNIRSIRPGNGLAPKHYEAVLGMVATRDIDFGEPLDESMIFGGITTL